MENILITGASSGIGHSLSKVFVRSGYRVFGSVRKNKDAEKLKHELGTNFLPLIFDITDHSNVAASINKLTEIIEDDGLACLINNAGIAVSGTVMHTSVDEYRRQFDINLFGLIGLTKACLPLLGAVRNCTHKPGRIINITSVSGVIAFPFLSPYCASKFALEAFSDSLRREMLIYGIDVVKIAPGPVKTPIWKKSMEIPTDILNSDYGPGITRFRYQVEKGIKSAMESDELAGKVLKVFEKKNPKARYVFLNNKFTNYTVPRYFISTRKFDAFIKKMFH